MGLAAALGGLGARSTYELGRADVVVLGYPATGPGWIIVEVIQKEPSARFENMRQPLHIAPPFVSSVDMKQPAIDHAGETPVPIDQCHGVFDQELHLQSTRIGLGPSAAD